MEQVFAKIRTALDGFFQHKKRSRIVGFLCIFAVLIAFFPAFRSGGHIVHGDLDFGFVLHGYIDRIYPLWNAKWSTATFFNGTRLPFVGPIYAIVSFFWDHPSWFQKIIIFSLLFTSGFGMFILVYEILKLERETKRLSLPYFLIFLISLGSWLYYALNPWNIMRIQHLYLLVGYAVLPFLFYEMLHLTERWFTDEPGWKGWISQVAGRKVFYHVFLIAVLYVIAIGAVHYLFFAFFFVGSWYAFRTISYIQRKEFRKLGIVTCRFLLFGILFIGIAAYWLLPYLGASTIASVNPPSINTIDSVTNLSRYATVPKILSLISYWWPMMDVDNLSPLFTLGWWLIVFVILVGGIIHRKNKFTLYFTLWSIAFIILSTGTKSPFLADFYKWIVFDNPAAGKMGFIFRDSNKLVGLLAFCFAILWGIGLAAIVDVILKKRLDKKLDRIQNLVMYTKYTPPIPLMNVYSLAFIGFFAIMILAYSEYVKPFYTHFLGYLYAPIEIPQDYQKLKAYERADRTNGKYLYLPRYEGINTPGYEFAVAKWNYESGAIAQRATSSFDLYTTIKPTYNPLEWATTFLQYFYEYTDAYLTRRYGLQLGKSLELIGVSRLAYHSDLINQEKEQAEQKALIERQNGVSKIANIGFFDIYSVPNALSYAQVFPWNAYVFGGFRNLESLFTNTDYPHRLFLPMFIDQDPITNTWKNLDKPADILIGTDRMDIELSMLDEKEYLFPFDANNYSDPFSRWGKLRTDVPDWRYHLKKLNIRNNSWDFDLNHGFVFTYVPAMLDLEPYVYIYNKGKDVINFQDVVDTAELFESSNKDVLNIWLSRTDKYASLPAVRGQIERWEGPIWKVASTKALAAKEKTAYVFELVMSGKGVNGIHGKVKFLNGSGAEIGLSYVSAPRNTETFNLIKYTGNFITPKWTAKMLLEINSLQNPGNQSFWWLHDMKIKELSEFTKANIQNMEFEFPKKGNYRVFVRYFRNIKGWPFTIQVGSGETRNLDSRSLHENRFSWKEIGTVRAEKQGKVPVALENIDGFNAVNAIAFVEESKFASIVTRTNDIKARQLIAIEPEISSEYEGNIQSIHSNPELSNGQSLNFWSGSVFNAFDLLHDGTYRFETKLNPLALSNGIFTFEIRTASGKSEFYRQITGKPGELITFSGITLPSGKHVLYTSIKDTVPSPVTSQWIRKYAPKSDHELIQKLYIIKEDSSVTERRKRDGTTIREMDGYDGVSYLEDEPGCSYFSPSNGKAVTYSTIWDIKHIQILAGLSCYWTISTHNAVHAEEDTEYLVSFGLRQETTKKFHAKINFLDKDFVQIMPEAMEINGEKAYKNILGDYSDPAIGTGFIRVENIVKTPPGTFALQLQFWQRQRQDVTSIVEVKDLQIKRYDSLPGIDVAYLSDERIGLESRKVPLVTTTTRYPNAMNRLITVAPAFAPDTRSESWAYWADAQFQLSLSGSILRIGENFSKLWQVVPNGSGGKREPMYGTFFLNAFPLNGSETVLLPGGKAETGVHIRYLPEKFMKPGYGLAILTLFLSFFVIILQAIRPETVLNAFAWLKNIRFPPIRLPWKK